jgi:site-specific DNA-methyltransferase (adenine-specific)
VNAQAASSEPAWEIKLGDALELVVALPPNSVDAVVTDPPYGIDFRREPWDHPGGPNTTGSSSYVRVFERWNREWATVCLRVLKPGGFLLAFGSPRTVHRLTAGLEDSGLEIRDQLLWLYGSGVPKNPAVAGRSSTLKPGYEPIILARAPLEGSLAENEQQFGTGRLSIDETRIRARGETRERWPCNVAVSHQPACNRRCARSCAVQLLDRSRPGLRPSRFYYCAKAGRREREAGCERLPARDGQVYGSQRQRARRNTHPTVKPVELMRWLVQLVSPPAGLVLDPFAGSGSTGIACLQSGRRFLGLEREQEYARIAHARLTYAARQATARRGHVIAEREAEALGATSAARNSHPSSSRREVTNSDQGSASVRAG